MARTFNGTTDVVQTTIGGLSGFAFGTFAAVVKRNSTAWNAVCILHSAGPTARSGMEIADNATGNQVTYQFPSGGTFGSSSFTVTNADGWVLIGCSKATGTTAPRFHKYAYSSDTWTHDNGAGTTAANNTVPGASGLVRIGEWQTSDFFGGDIAVVGCWQRALSDIEFQELAFSLQGWYSTAPDALWVLDQAATTTSLLDLTGGHADQSSITGTTVSANSVPILGYGHDPIVLSSSAATSVVTPTQGPLVVTPSWRPLGVPSAYLSASQPLGNPAVGTPGPLVVSPPFRVVPVPPVTITASQPLGNPAVGTPRPLVVGTPYAPVPVPGALLRSNPAAPVISTIATPSPLVIGPPYQPVPVPRVTIVTSSSTTASAAPLVVVPTFSLAPVPGAKIFAAPVPPVASVGTPGPLVVTPAFVPVPIPRALFSTNRPLGVPAVGSPQPLVVTPPFRWIQLPAPLLGSGTGTGQPCVIPRPNTGTTARPGTGTTLYAIATTSRPTSGVTARPDTGITEDPC